MEGGDNVPLLKLIQYPWSIKTHLTISTWPFTEEFWPLRLSEHTDRKAKNYFSRCFFAHGWCISSPRLRHLFTGAGVSLRHCLLLAPNRLLLASNHKRAQKIHLNYLVLSSPQLLPFSLMISVSTVKGFSFEIQYAALLQTVCSLVN